MRAKTLLTMVVTGLILLATAGCPINHWSARQELWEEGYSDVMFGHVPDEEADEHPFFAKRGNNVCSGIITLGDAEPTIVSNCYAMASHAGH